MPERIRIEHVPIEIDLLERSIASEHRQVHAEEFAIDMRRKKIARMERRLARLRRRLKDKS